MSAICLKGNSGFSLITAIFILVILASLGAAIVTITGVEQTSSALDVQGSRAYQAAHAGIEWASYQLLINQLGPVTYQSSSSNGTTTLPNLTINKPAGTVQNDVLIAGITFRPNSPGSPVEHSTDIGIASVPAGWSLVPSGRLDAISGNQTSSGLVVYWKVAGASEPASYTWSFSCTGTCASLGFNAATGGILRFSGVNTTSPIDVEAGLVATTNSYDIFTASVTTTVANDMLVTTHETTNGDTWQNPPPSGMTQAFQITTNNAMLQMSYAIQAAAGATGQKKAHDNGPDGVDFGIADILALQPGPTPSAFATACNAGSTSQNLTGMGGTLSGFTAAVTCSSSSFTEGANTVWVYQITSTGSSGSVGTLNRVERQLQATLAK